MISKWALRTQEGETEREIFGVLLIEASLNPFHGRDKMCRAHFHFRRSRNPWPRFVLPRYDNICSQLARRRIEVPQCFVSCFLRPFVGERQIKLVHDGFCGPFSVPRIPGIPVKKIGVIRPWNRMEQTDAVPQSCWNSFYLLSTHVPNWEFASVAWTSLKEKDQWRKTKCLIVCPPNV